MRDELNRLAEQADRAEELAQRLVCSGPKAAHVSASETHEISEWIIEAAPVLRTLAARAQPAGEVGPLDLSAPPTVWLQIDTSGNNDDRSQPIPRESWDELTWCAESVGGQEVVYVRKDLAFSARAQGVPEGWRVKRFSDGAFGLFAPQPAPGVARQWHAFYPGFGSSKAEEFVCQFLSAMLTATPAPDPVPVAQAKGEVVAYLIDWPENPDLGHYFSTRPVGGSRCRPLYTHPAQHAPTGAQVVIARQLSDWHEDMGPVTWWKFPVEEAAYIGTPNDSDWPGYHTHFTPHPQIPNTAEENSHD